MPWSPSEAKAHNSAAVGHKAVVWAHAANAFLAQCRAKGGKDCEAHAIRVANAAIAHGRKGK